MIKVERILALAVLVLFISCKKSDDTIQPIVKVDLKHKLSGIVTTPGGTPLNGIPVAFEIGKSRYDDTTDEFGKYLFEATGTGQGDLLFDGNQIGYLDMRDRQVEFGGVDRTFDKMMAPWEIEEIYFLTTNFIDIAEKEYSLVHYNFEYFKMQPSDFKNLIGTPYLDDYETIFTSVQSTEETEINVSFYSMPLNSGYTLDNNHTITNSDVLGWRKILTISTSTTLTGDLHPVKVNLASAFADHADYNHSGTIVIVSDAYNSTLGVTSPVDVLDIRLPYGDDY